MVGRVDAWIRRFPIASFFALAFLWSWSYDAIIFLVVGEAPGILVRGIVRTWGPLIAAGIVTWRLGGRVREWAGQVTKWRVAPGWYLATLLLPLLLEGGLGVALIVLLSGGSVELGSVPWWQYLASFLIVLFFAGSLEEFGWRGFVQPRLQERFSALSAAALIGVAWALWHLPLFYLYDVAAYDASGFWTTYLFGSITSSIVYAFLFNGTGGSLLFPMIAHSLGNLPAFVAPTDTIEGVIDVAPELLAMVVLVCLILLYGRQYLAPRSPTPPIPGGADVG